MLVPHAQPQGGDASVFPWWFGLHLFRNHNNAHPPVTEGHLVPTKKGRQEGREKLGRRVNRMNKMDGLFEALL